MTFSTSFVGTRALAPKFRGGIAALLVAVFAAGCAAQSPVAEATIRIDEVQPSGFLNDYSILRPGEDGEAALVYRNPDADFSRYNAVFIEPVTLWLGTNSSLNEVDADERQKLADEFYAEIVKALEGDFKITAQPGPGTMRIRVALTDARASSPTLDTLSTYVPQARLLQSAAALGSETAGFVGEASAEAEVRDAETGVLLVAGVDRRAGTKALGDSTFDAWSDVRRAFETWSVQFVNNLRRSQRAS